MGSWITIISVVVNAVAAVVAPFIKKKIDKQKESLEKVEDVLETVSDGLTIVEQAIEENKDALKKSGPGDRVVQTIRTYGPAAKHAVDEARSLASKLGEGSWPQYAPAAPAPEPVPENAPQ